MILSGYGRREWLTALLAAAALAIPAWLLGWWPVAAVAVLAFAATAWFFRDPLGRRPAEDSPLAMVSPADGRISAVLREESHEALEGAPAVVVRIFLSVLDVHINRSPAASTVRWTRHRPGRYLDARSEASAKLNESMLISLSLEDGRTIGVKQISGAIARRIVCPLEPGRRLGRGERFGMIKFGSTTELILPDPDRVGVAVKVGDRVVGGVTILARIPPAASP
jgi:phosphatidylserine decarboxylase